MLNISGIFSKILVNAILMVGLGLGLFHPYQSSAATEVGGSIYTDTWTTAGSPYLVTSHIKIVTDNTLTIEPGVIVKLSPGISVTTDGGLIAQGTATAPIVFTSVKDDSYAGDTNGDDTMTTPAGGDWRGFILQSIAPSSVIMDYVTILYAGTDDQSALRINSDAVAITYSTIATTGGDEPMVYFNTTATFSNNTLRNSAGTAIYIPKVSPTITGNTISGSTWGCGISINHGAPTLAGNTITDTYIAGICVLYGAGAPIITDNTLTNNPKGITIDDASAQPILTNNSIYGNTNYGVYSVATQTIKAEYNWWGDASGPYHTTANPTGLGDTVYGSVDIEPWLSSDPAADTTAPTDVTIERVRKDRRNKIITLYWTNPADTDFDHVQIDRTGSDDSMVTLADNITTESYMDAAITKGVAYVYTLYSVDTSGNVSSGVSTNPITVRSSKTHRHSNQLRQ